MKACILKEKLKALKNKIRWWNKEVFGWLDMKVYDKVKEVNGFDVLLENCEEELVYEV